MTRLVSYNDGDIPAGGQAWLDGNYGVTVVAVRAPVDDHDAGSVQITYSWGAADSVAPSRLGAYIAD